MNGTIDIWAMRIYGRSVLIFNIGYGRIKNWHCEIRFQGIL